MNTVLTQEHKPTGIVITVHGHEWEPHVPQSPGPWRGAKLPPPFDSWGPQTSWRLLSCGAQHEGSCADFTVRSCADSETRRSRLLQNFNLVFGVTRNKAFATAFRARKQALAAEEEEEAEDDEQEDDDDDDAESSSSSDAVEDDSVDEEDAAEEEDEDEEEEAAEPEVDDSSSTSSSSSSEAPRKTKRGVKRAAPSK